MVVEVVYVVPEKVQYANMDDWKMDCPWWLVLSGIPVKRSASLFSMYHASDELKQKGLEPNVAGDQVFNKPNTGGLNPFRDLDFANTRELERMRSTLCSGCLVSR